MIVIGYADTPKAFAALLESGAADIADELCYRLGWDQSVAFDHLVGRAAHLHRDQDLPASTALMIAAHRWAQELRG